LIETTRSGYSDVAPIEASDINRQVVAEAEGKTVDRATAGCDVGGDQATGRRCRLVDRIRLACDEIAIGKAAATERVASAVGDRVVVE
jgi:hypothetical protein